MVARLARFLHEYRRTPGKDGRSPSQRLLGYDKRSRLDAALPPLPTPFSQPETNPFRPGQPVWFRNYSLGDKWSPGIVKSTSGCRLVHRRHADQLRRRDPGDTAPEPSAPAPASEAAPPEAVPTSDVPAPVPQTPRRSTRSHLPPSRLFCKSR